MAKQKTLPYEVPAMDILELRTEDVVCGTNNDPAFRDNPSMGYANGGEEDSF